MRDFVVAFTGHRSYNHESCTTLLDNVMQLYGEGARTFRVGVAAGFDLAAAEAVLNVMQRYDEVSLEAYIPYPSFAAGFTPVDRSRYERVLQCCSRVVYVAKGYDKEVYRRRNDMLVAGAQVVVAWWSGKPGGTAYTVGRARRNRCRIINLYGAVQQRLEF